MRIYLMLLGSLASVSTVCGAVPASAQVTYNVFPAVPPELGSRTAQPGKWGAGAVVTLVVQDSTVDYAVHEIARQAHLRPVYDNSGPLVARRITVRIENASPMTAFAEVLKGTGFVARLAPDGETVVIRAAGASAHERSRFVAAGVIMGRVTDSASGAGLGGATVRVEGSKFSAVTSDSGNFTLKDVPSGDQVISVKLFGYRPAERTVTVVDSSTTTVRIVMVPVPTVLSGVVTTATGQQQRYQVGNDITVLNADSIQQIAPVSNLTQMLETRVPGLIVQRTSGIPGAPSRLRLRGLSSVFQSGDPILIVDGIRIYANQSGNSAPSYSTNQSTVVVGSASGGGSSVKGVALGDTTVSYAGPSPLDQIDPNTIETIEVLKGPSSTAIYGSDAANGVIIITTKHGHAGPTRWTLSLDQGRTTLLGSWPINFYKFSSFGTVYGQNPSGPCDLSSIESGFCPPDSVVAFQALNDPRYSPLTGQPGQNRDASLTVSGGSGPLTYSVTGSASNQTGYLHLPPIEQQRFDAFHGFPAPNWMVTPDNYATYGASSQLTAQLGQSGATLALSSSLFHSAQQQSSLQNDLGALQFMYVDTTQLAEQPLFPDYYTRARLNTLTINNDITLNNWTPWRWLPPLSATVGLNVENQDNNSLLPRDYITCVNNSYDSRCGQDSLGAYSISQGTKSAASLTVGTTFLPGRVVSTAVGFNVYTITTSTTSGSEQGLNYGVSVPTFGCSGGSNSNCTSGSSSASSATYGWYVQPTLNLFSRFFVSPGFRLDGGSTSGTNSQLNLFPKIDLSYVAVSRPPSHPLFGALTLLRPRIAFGIAGVQPGPAEQLRLLAPQQITPVVASGTGTPVDGLGVSTLGNTQLHPERDTELEGGVDAQFWNQRLSVTLTDYHKMAYDAILAIPVAPSVLPSGVTPEIAKNFGTIRNTGVEATVFARLVDSRAVDWSVNANVAQNHNLVVSLVSGQPPIVLGQNGSAYQTRLTPGFPLNGIWARPILGYYDANHDGLIEPNEVVVGDSAQYLGAPLPNYELTLSTTLAFFNDRLSINTSFDYQNGLTQINSGNVSYLDNQINNPSTTPAQQAAIAAVVGCASNNGCTAFGEIQTVNTLRWSSLSVNYLVPTNVARLVRVPSLSVAIQGSNLGLHSNYRGKDPNVNAYASGNLTADLGELPQPRLWSLRVSIGH